MSNFNNKELLRDRIPENKVQNTVFNNSVEQGLEFDIDPTSITNVVSMPSIMISKIVLDKDIVGTDSEMYDKDPHIEDVAVTELKVDRFGKTKLSHTSKDLATKSIESESLSVNVKLSLKEILDANGHGTWYDNPDFLKYLKIRIVMSTSQGLTSQIASGKITLDPLSYSKSKYTKFIKEKIISVENEISKNINDYIHYVVEGNKKIYDVSFETTFKSQQLFPKHVSIFAVTFLDSEQIVTDHGCGAGNYSATGNRTTFGDLTGERVIDKSAVNTSGAVFTTEKGKVWLGPISYRKNSKTYATARGRRGKKLIRTATSVGKIYDMRDALSPEEAAIEFAIIENKVLNLNFSTLQRTLAEPLRATEYFTDIFATRDKHGNFRAAFGLNYQKLLRDKTEFGKLFENNNLPTLRALSNMCRLTQIKVLRERVENLTSVNRLNVPMEGRELFKQQNQGFSKHVVAYSSETASGKFKSYRVNVDSSGKSVQPGESTASGGKTSVQGSIQEVGIYPENFGKIRHFSFSDKDISKETDGLYRYGVQVTIEDGTRDYIDKLKAELLSAKQQLSKYYNEASNSENNKPYYNAKNDRYTRSYINDRKIQYAIPNNGNISGKTYQTIASWSDNAQAPVSNHEHNYVLDSRGNGRTVTVNGHYHIVTNYKIGPAIVDGEKINAGHHHLTKTIGSVFDAPWVRPITQYMQTLNILTAGSNSIDTTKIAKVFYYMLSPHTGSPQNILRITKLVDNLYTQLNKIGGSPRSLSSPARHKRSLGPPHRLFIEKWFDYVHDSNVPKLTGFDYLNDMKFVESGLKRVIGNYYVTRAQEETNKFIDTPTAGVSLNIGKVPFVTNDSVYNTELSFFSPASVELGGESTSLLYMGDVIEQSSIIENLESKILEFNFTPVMIAPKTSMTAATTNISTNDSLSKVFNNMNIKIDSLLTKNGVKLFFTEQEQEDCLNKARSYLGENSLMISANMSVLNLLEDDVGKPTKDTQDAITGVSNGLMSTVLEPIKNSIDNPFNSYVNPFSSADKSIVEVKSRFDVKSSSNFISENNLTVNDFATLPNHMKVLFLPNSKEIGIGKAMFSDKEKTGLTEAAQKSIMRFNYEFLKMVEVFVGYEETKHKEILVKNPIWEMMTYDIYNNSIGQTLLCRLRNYDNNSVGINYKTSSSLPTYDEHFLMTPTKAVGVKMTIKNSNRLTNYVNKSNSNNTSMLEIILDTIDVNARDTSRINSNMAITQPAQQARSGNFSKTPTQQKQDSSRAATVATSTNMGTMY